MAEWIHIGADLALIVAGILLCVERWGLKQDRDYLARELDRIGGTNKHLQDRLGKAMRATTGVPNVNHELDRGSRYDVGGPGSQASSLQSAKTKVDEPTVSRSSERHSLLDLWPEACANFRDDGMRMTDVGPIVDKLTAYGLAARRGPEPLVYVEPGGDDAESLLALVPIGALFERVKSLYNSDTGGRDGVVSRIVEPARMKRTGETSAQSVGDVAQYSQKGRVELRNS